MSTRFRFFGPEAPLSPIAREIMSESIPALEQRVAAGLDLDAPLRISGLIAELPITLALVENRLAVLDFLLAHGVDLNDENSPAIVAAARNCAADVLQRLVQHGARVDAVDRVGKNAYQAALYSGRLDLLPVLLSLGLPIDADRGTVLRQAVSNGQFDAVKFFVEHGMDPDVHVPDQVFPHNPTAVAVAAEAGSLEMVQYLVEHGADVTLEDDRGDRPYSRAIAKGHDAVRDYLRSVEPPHLHDVALRLRSLEEFRLPVGLLELLNRADRRVELSGGPIRFVEFHSLLGVKVLHWQDRKLLDLLAKADGYWECGFLAWSPKDQLLVNLDLESDELRLLFSWERFHADPSCLWGDLMSTPPL